MKNFVELIGHYGSDETHGLSAWTSTSRDLDDEKRARIPKLLGFLAENEHETPFEKSALHFLATVDQPTHIHLLKHRIGVSINAESARYKELKEDKMYIPADWNVKSGKFNTLFSLHFDGTDTWADILAAYAQLGNDLYHKSLQQLTPVVGRKRAKDSARFFKAMNSQITMDIMFNWRSFYHFQCLRNSPDAQLEVREIAQEMLRLVKEIPGKPFQHTIKAFGL